MIFDFFICGQFWLRSNKQNQLVKLFEPIYPYQLIFEEEWLVELQESLFKLDRPLWGDF